MDVKSIFKSKTFWFGALYVVIGVAGLFGFAQFQPDPKLVDGLAALTGVIVVILRLVTKQPVSLS
jgi:hypothetical protein